MEHNSTRDMKELAHERTKANIPDCSFRGIPPTRDDFGRLGQAWVHLDRWGTYTGHRARYGSHEEYVMRSQPQKDGFVVHVPITSWDRLDILKEAHSCFNKSNKAPVGYKDLYRDWGPVDQFLQTHPDCTRYDLRMYPDHPQHVPQQSGWVRFSSPIMPVKDCVQEEMSVPQKRPRLH